MTTPPNPPSDAGPPSSGSTPPADRPPTTRRASDRRHSAGGRRLAVAPWIIVTVVVLVVLAGLTVGYLALTRDDTADRPPCTGSVVLPVAAAPGAAPALQEAARRFDATGPTARSTCVRTSVVQAPGAQVAQNLAGGWVDGTGDAPAVWAVDDEADLGTVEATQSALTAGRSTQLSATSPVVLAVRPDAAAALSGRSWADLLADASLAGRIALPDPRENRATAYALQSMIAPAGTTAAVDTAAVTAAGPALQALAAGGAATGVATTADALPQVAAGGSFTAVPVTEADLAAYNSGAGGQAALVAVYPSGPTAGDEILPVALSAPWVTPTLKAAAGAFLAYLRSADGQAAFTDSGLRPAGTSAGSASAAASSGAPSAAAGSAAPSAAAASAAPSAGGGSGPTGTDPVTGVDRSTPVDRLPDAGADVTAALAQALGLPA